MSQTSQKQEGGLRTKGILKQPNEGLPLVSVITIVLNNVNHIEQTIQSVLNQSYKFIEYIIIDGGSTDGTIDIIRKYENNIDYWISELDNGIANAMNKGIIFAKGALINHLNGGDRFASPDVVAFVIESYRSEKWRWCYGHEKVINSQGDIVGELNPGRFNKFFLNFRNFITHQTVFIEKSLFDEAGYFDTRFKIAMDYHMWLRVQDICKPKSLDKTIAEFLQGGVSSNIKYGLQEKYKARCLVMKRPYIVVIIDYILIWILWIKNKIGIKGSMKFIQKYYSFFSDNF